MSAAGGGDGGNIVDVWIEMGMETEAEAEAEAETDAEAAIS